MWKLAIIVIFYYHTVHAQRIAPTFCRRYGVTSEQLMKNRGKAEFDDGAGFEVVAEGSLRLLRLSFNKTVDLFSVTAQMRVNHDLRVTVFDKNESFSRYYQIPAGKQFPLETELPDHPAIRKVTLQGFDAQLTSDEITYVNITVCAHNCRSITNCFGTCFKVEKDFGCMECECPDGSPSSGCSGLPENDLGKLMSRVKRQEAGCRFDIGYKRMINKELDIDDCIGFNYPKCDSYKDIIVPNKRIDCLKYCY